MKVLQKILEKKIAHLVCKFLLFLGILFIMDFCIGKTLKHYYFKADYGTIHRTTYAIDSTEANIIFLGSSYAHRHFVPEIFESSFHMSVYNAGRDGNYIFYQYSLLKAILKRYTPKIIIMDFNYAAFEKGELSYETMSSLLPYYDDHLEIRSLVQLRGPFEKYKLISKIYPYNSIISDIIYNSLGLRNLEVDKYEDRGFVPLLEINKQSISVDTLSNSYELDQTKIKIFKCFIKDCQKANIKLYIVVSPRIIIYKYEDPSLVLAKKISEEFNIPFYNFLNNKDIINHPQLFADQHHLNDSGAKIFSKEIAKIILRNGYPKF